MEKFRTAASAIIMIIAAIAGFFIGGILDDNGTGGAILFSMIAGISCIVYTIDNHEKLR